MELVIKWAVPFILTGLVGTIIKTIKDGMQMKKALLSLIRFEIVKLCDKANLQGYLSEYGRICLESLSATYKNLGGNHGIDKLVDKTFSLPNKQE